MNGDPTESSPSDPFASPVGDASSDASELRQHLGYPACERLTTANLGVLILDLFGVIRFCSLSLLDLIGDEQIPIVGRPVRTLLLDLPFREETPGCNIGVALVWFAESSQTLRLLRADRSIIQTNASVSHYRIDGQHLFCVELRGPMEHPSATEEQAASRARLSQRRLA